MNKDHLLNLLCSVYTQEISADGAFDELEGLIDRIKRLEEAGDWLSTRVGWGEREQWNKAKEDKP